MRAQYRPQVAEVRAVFPDQKTDWIVNWTGSAFNLAKIQAAVASIEGSNGRAFIFIPETNTIYKPIEYPKALWVRVGVEYLQKAGVYTVNRKASA